MYYSGNDMMMMNNDGGVRNKVFQLMKATYSIAGFWIPVRVDFETQNIQNPHEMELIFLQWSAMKTFLK